MQTASELREKGVKRTKVTRDDGHVFVTLESPERARTIYTPEDGFTAITEVFGYDPELDGPARPKDDTADLLAKLDEDELAELTDTLYRGWIRAGEVYPIMSEDFPIPGVDLTRNFNRNPIVWDLEKTYMPVLNECDARYLGCRWSSCAVCRHESCRFCPACNSGHIAPDGEVYDDDVRDAPVGCCH
jgi:hypothetical protein